MFEDLSLLKEKLGEIKKNNYEVPRNISPYDFTLVMMKNVGSTDPELRDLLINRVITKWILNDVLTTEQLRELLNININEEHLFFGIGEDGTDSVFTRAFCALNIEVILSVNRNKKFLLLNEVKAVKESLVKYYRNERDYRGHVEEKGWADSTSHGADVLCEVALCEELDKSDLLDLLAAIKDKLYVNSYTYVDFEDERITTPVVNILDRKLIEISEIVEWVRSFKNIPRVGQPNIDFRAIMNIRNFLRSLYFRILERNDMKEIVEAIMETLKSITTY